MIDNFISIFFIAYAIPSYQCILILFLQINYSDHSKQRKKISMNRKWRFNSTDNWNQNINTILLIV